MEFDPDAPIDVLDPPVTKPAVKPVVFHPDAAVEIPTETPPLVESPGKGVGLVNAAATFLSGGMPALAGQALSNLPEKLVVPSTVDPDKLWQTAKNPGTRMRALYLKFFGSNAAIRTDFAPTPMIGSEAAGTKGGLVTIPAAEGTGKGAGLINAANKFSAGLTSPENVALLFGTEGAGVLADLLPATRAAVAARVAQTATLGTFTALGAKDTVQAVSDVQQVLADPKATDADKADALATAFLSGGMTALAGVGTKKLAGKIGEKPDLTPYYKETVHTSSPVMFKPEAPVEFMPSVESVSVPSVAAPLKPVVETKKSAPVSAETPSVSAVQKFEPEAPVDAVPETKAPELETVKAPASRYAGVVYEGEHHQDTYNQIRQATGRKMNMDDPAAEGIEAGFVTSTGRFVSREEAYKVARAGGQIKRAFGTKPELLNEAMKGEPRLAPATFGGTQEGARGAPGFDFYTLDEDIAGHPKGSSVTGETLIKAGYKLPEKPAPKTPVSGMDIDTSTPEGKKVVEASRKLTGEPPATPNFATASSDEISNWHQGMREYDRNTDVRVLGEDLAKEYRRLTRVAESTMRNANDPKVVSAMKRLGEIESGLSPEQQRAFYGMDLPKDFVDSETSRDLSRQASDIDTSDSVQELGRVSSRIIQSALRKMAKGEALEGRDSEFFMRVMKRAKELDVTPQELVKTAFQYRAKFEGNDVFELAGVTPEQLSKFLQEPGAKKPEPSAPAQIEQLKTAGAPPAESFVDVDALTAQQTEILKKLSESKLLALTKQLDLDPKGMSGDRLRARIQSNAHPEDIADALKGRGLISGSAAEKWADDVLKKKRGQLNAGIDPEQFAAYTVKGVANFERGVTDFAKWSAEMVRELGDEIKPHLVRLYRAAKELHEEGARAAEASPEELTAHLADFRSTPKPTEATPASRTTSVMSSMLRGEHPDVTGALKGLAGESAPKTSTLNESAGDALVRYASAQIAAPEIAKSYAGRVLGEHLHDAAFAQKLGAVLNEDRLRTIKAGFLKQAAELKAAGDTEASAEMQQRADQVTSMVGLKGSPFKTEADFKAALADAEIKAAVERHKELVQPFAEKMHVDLGGRTAKPGQNTGAFVNLLPIDEEGTALRGGLGKGGATGDFTTPFKKGSAFNKKSFGSAANYVNDYNEIVKAMITGNFTETAKRTLYDKLQEAGLGAVLPPGEEPPTFNGQPARKIQIERRGLGGRTIVRNLWVDRRIYPELVRGMGLDETFKNAAVTHLANVLNTIQIKGPVDGVAHVANILTSISGSQGGKNVVTDLIRKMGPGVNVMDALTRIFLRARDVVKDSPEVRDQLAKIAEIGASRQPHEGAKGLSKLIIMVDKAARLVRNDMYDNLVARGLAEDSEAGRREFINQVGQYNSRLQGQMTAKFKEWGLSPFVVAGQNFNRNALRRVTATPGVRTASTEANVKLRAVELAGLAATLVAVPMAINYVLTGKPQGRPGVPFGAIDTGKTTDDGKAVIVDPQQWTGVRRGLRLTGVNAALSSQQRGDTAAHTVDAAARDIIGGFIHPFAGPAVNTAITAATGYNAAFFRQAAKAAPGESQMAQNAIAAAKQLNPFVGNAIEGLQNDSSVGWGLAKGLAKPFSSAAGIKTAAVTSNEQTIQTKATQFNDTLGIARYEGGRPSDYVDLTKAIRTENYEHAADALQALIQRKAAEIPGNMATTAKEATARREVVEYYRRKAQAPFTGSLARERVFKATLDADEQATYDAARAHYRQMAQSVRRLLYGQ